MLGSRPGFIPRQAPPQEGAYRLTGFQMPAVGIGGSHLLALNTLSPTFQPGTCSRRGAAAALVRALLWVSAKCSGEWQRRYVCVEVERCRQHIYMKELRASSTLRMQGSEVSCQCCSSAKQTAQLNMASMCRRPGHCAAGK